MLHSVIPLGVIFPDGNYPSEEGMVTPDIPPEARCVAESEPISTNLRDHLKKRGE